MEERTHYENVIAKLNSELQASRVESPRKKERINRRNRLKEGVRLLKLDLARAQHLVNEANTLCERLQRDVAFSVTLRIPPSRLGPSTDTEARLLCHAAIKLQRQGREDAIWTVEKLEDRMSEMRAELFAMSDDEGKMFIMIFYAQIFLVFDSKVSV